jgi:hypothetical protein
LPSVICWQIQAHAALPLLGGVRKRPRRGSAVRPDQTENLLVPSIDWRFCRGNSPAHSPRRPFAGARSSLEPSFGHGRWSERRGALWKSSRKGTPKSSNRCDNTKAAN